jgi:alkylhydroperoxidase family enzyme
VSSQQTPDTGGGCDDTPYANPALLPEALDAALALSASAAKGDLPPHLVELVLLRASQIKGCGVCVDMHTKGAKRSDRPDPVPDEVWDEAARHFDEVALASLLVTIGVINVFNRLNVATRQVAGSVPLPA